MSFQKLSHWLDLLTCLFSQRASVVHSEILNMAQQNKTKICIQSYILPNSLLAKKVIVLSGFSFEDFSGTRSFELRLICVCPYSNTTALPSAVHANHDIAGPTALPAVWQLHPVPVHIWILTNTLNFVLNGC